MRQSIMLLIVLSFLSMFTCNKFLGAYHKQNINQNDFRIQKAFKISELKIRKELHGAYVDISPVAGKLQIF